MMKKILILTAILVLSFTNAQELKTVKLLPPESKDLSDLAFLKEELQGKELVMLGEYTHMYGNIFEMKARVVEYLHQELGYTTFAIESPMYDIWKINQKGFDKTEFNEAIWGVWSSSKEFQRLVNYIEENNLKVIGFDSQIINSSSFIEDFFDYCDNQNIVIKLDEDDMGIIIEGILENVTVEEDDIHYKIYEKEIKRIIKQIERLENNNLNFYWSQFIKSLLACTQDAYYNKEEILTTDLGNKNHNIRDEQMADNLLSYIHRNPSEKIICWADNIHIIKDNSSIDKLIARDFVSMGSYIHQELKEKAYSLATIHANDSLLDLGTNKWHLTPIKSNSFEYELKGFNKPFLFVSSNQEAMQSTKFTRLLNFVDFTKARTDQLYDGYIFFEKASLPKRETISDSITQFSESVDVNKKIDPIKAGEKVILKGQLLDKESNHPIPFATLILKKEEIYRVADENGFYELPVKNSLIESSEVTISSIGYENKTILLSDLQSKTYIKPKFERLEEVLITGYLSPKTVLKKAISKRKLNHPTEPFNFHRYGNVLINKNDTTVLDLEVITKDYDDGYLSPFIITQRVEQIKWNKNIHPQKYKYSSQFFAYRQNAIRYANILHKRKYKKFKLSFVKSDNTEDYGQYIISFETKRNKWNYTNRGYPTTYSGRVYIDKASFGIVKVVENWETTLDSHEIEKYFKGYQDYKNILRTTIKEENICYYSDVLDDGKFYATRYFNRSYNETLNKENKRENSVLEMDSYLYDFQLKDVEEIEYYEYNNKKENSLYRISYSQSFWDTFYEEKLPLLLN